MCLLHYKQLTAIKLLSFATMNIIPLQMGYFQRWTDAYFSIWKTADRRVDGLPLMSSIKPMVILLMVYLAFIFAGPRYMSKRKALKLTGIMAIYNGTMSLVNLYISIQMAIAATRLNYNWFCEICHSEATDVEELRMVNAIYLYMLTKPIEWLDTFFIVIRKKNSQISFLDVYHHLTVFIITWVTARWVPSGSTFFPMFLNSIVHVVMYCYYGLTVFGPRVQKYLWWKKYLTLFQMTQFSTVLIQGFSGLLTGCQYTKWIQYMIVGYMCSFLVLFGTFYYSTYIYKHHLKKK